ncbi:MAG: VOC family protein [Rickettsiales bacterium]|nr:VOC family protein [Rickettsiales bacterium]
MTYPRFHLAFPVTDASFAKTRHFYFDIMGCTEGRSAERWVDFDFFGHQISAHLVSDAQVALRNEVDGDQVPVRHFGVILPWDEWHQLAERLKAAQLSFIIEPHVRFKGQVGEQATMFLLDPSGNALEFKSFKEESSIFAR